METISAGEPPAVEQAVIGVLEHQAAAWNRGDIDAFMDTYWKSDRLTFSSGGKTTRGWQATLERYKKRYPDRQAMGSLRFEKLEVTLLSPDAALVLGRWIVTTDTKQAAGNFSLVLRKLKQSWVIIHDHTSLQDKETP